MDLIGERGPFPRFVADTAIGSWSVTLLDIGCSGGLDTAWRSLGDRLVAVGFDPSVQEIERLRSVEQNPRVIYEAAFVVPGRDAAKELKPGGHPYITHSPWPRLAIARTLKILADQIAAKSDVEKLATNSWQETQLTPEAVLIPDYLRDRHIGSVDFIKLDIDGPDFQVLTTLSETLRTHQVLGLGLEVNFIGSDDPTDHTFHNTDRFMRAHGFALFGLTIRPYSAAALPHRYKHHAPNVSIAGRPFQGDALYLRDLCAPEHRGTADRYGPEKLVSLAALFSLSGLPDHAGEVLVNFREQLTPLIDVDRGLDLLTEETELGRELGLTYHELIAAFQRNDPIFYPRRS